eukprot:scaffold96424_cov54-Phaeocystis_antarctica.AAC.3
MVLATGKRIAQSIVKVPQRQREPAATWRSRQGSHAGSRTTLRTSVLKISSNSGALVQPCSLSSSPT